MSSPPVNRAYGLTYQFVNNVAVCLYNVTPPVWVILSQRIGGSDGLAMDGMVDRHSVVSPVDLNSRDRVGLCTP